MKEKDKELTFDSKDAKEFREHGLCPYCGCSMLDLRTGTNGTKCQTEVKCNGCGLVFIGTYILEKIEFDGWLYGKAVADVGRKDNSGDNTNGQHGNRGRNVGDNVGTDRKADGKQDSKVGRKRKVRKQNGRVTKARKDSKARRKKANSKV